jgi:hypothetical protein
VAGFGRFADLAYRLSLEPQVKGFVPVPETNKHAQLISAAVEWLRRKYCCGVVLSEQYCATGEVPDAIGWKGLCRSVVVECKASRADFLADSNKPFRTNPGEGLGCERFYLAPPGLIAPGELPQGWGLLEYRRGKVQVIVKPNKRKNLRTEVGLMKEMNLLLASLRRVEVRIEPQTITEFLKWKNRMADYNGGPMPEGLTAPEQEENVHLHISSIESGGRS